MVPEEITLNKYTVYLRNRKKPIKVMAHKWNAMNSKYITFYVDEVEIMRVDFHEMVALKKEVIK